VSTKVMEAIILSTEAAALVTMQMKAQKKDFADVLEDAIAFYATHYLIVPPSSDPQCAREQELCDELIEIRLKKYFKKARKRKPVRVATVQKIEGNKGY